MEIKPIISFLFLLQAILNIVDLDLAMAQQSMIFRCRNTGNYTTPIYKNNIKTTLDGVANNIASHKGFYHSSFGVVNAIGLCPGYISPEKCANCVKNSISPLMERNCPKQKEGVAWSLQCMVRYSDRKILGVLDDWVWVHLPEPFKASRTIDMDKALSTLANKLKMTTVEGGSDQKFDFAYFTYAPDSVPMNTLYAAMQCTPDLSKEQCDKCLMSIMLTMHSCCSGKMGARMLSPNCYLRYTHYKFDVS